MSYQCEYIYKNGQECSRPAVVRWTDVDDEAQETYSTYRCDEHPEPDFPLQTPIGEKELYLAGYYYESIK